MEVRPTMENDENMATKSWRRMASRIVFSWFRPGTPFSQ